MVDEIFPISISSKQRLYLVILSIFLIKDIRDDSIRDQLLGVFSLNVILISAIVVNLCF